MSAPTEGAPPRRNHGEWLRGRVPLQKVVEACSAQPGVARFEAGGTMPTPPLLERLAAALGLTVNVSLEPAGRRSA